MFSDGLVKCLLVLFISISMPFGTRVILILYCSAEGVSSLDAKGLWCDVFLVAFLSGRLLPLAARPRPDLRLRLAAVDVVHHASTCTCRRLGRAHASSGLVDQHRGQVSRVVVAGTRHSAAHAPAAPAHVQAVVEGCGGRRAVGHVGSGRRTQIILIVIHPRHVGSHS